MAFLDESGLQRYTDRIKEYVTRHLSTVDLTNYTTKTQVLDYVNESLTDYITVDDLSDYGFLTEVPSEYVTDGELEEMGYATEDWVQGKGYLTEHQDISNLATKDEIPSLEGYALKDWTHQIFAKKLHEYVDLGLPSGNLWATTNIGATLEYDFGDKIAWGEIGPKNIYNWSTYKWCDGLKTTLTKYNSDSEYGIVDEKIFLEIEDDAASVNWGELWRIPTTDDCAELNNCTWTQAIIEGVDGSLITGPNGNSIFIPSVNLSSVYWTNTSLSDAKARAMIIRNSGGPSISAERYEGCYIRPVRSAIENTVLDIVDLSDSTGLRETWSAKQDAIPDLDTIRSGASKGETSLLETSEVITNIQTLILDIAKLKTSIGFDDDVTVSFIGTNNLDECTTLIEAILKLDSLLTTLTT